MQKKSYHDYVIKDGVFLGEFEEMYKGYDDPWNQSDISYSISRSVNLINLNKYNISSVVEFGCGLGYFSNMINTHTRSKVTGVDISQSAIDKAKLKFPELNFFADDISNIHKYKMNNAVIFAEITWYILPILTKIFNEMLIHFEGKIFFHNLVFYQDNKQKYGRDYFTNVEEFIEFCPFQLLEKTVMTPTDHSKTIESHCVFKIKYK